MGKLSEGQKEFYENVRQVTREEIKGLSDQIQMEIASIRERISKLNREIYAVRQMYDSACIRLGMNPDSDSFISAPTLGDMTPNAVEDESDEITLGDDLLEATGENTEEEIEY